MVAFLANLPLWARALCFKLGWLALVLGKANAIVPVLLVWLLVVSGFSSQLRRTLGVVFVAGVVLDALAVSSGVLMFHSAALGLPLYFIMLWGWFALCWLWCLVHWFGRGWWLAGFTLAMPLAYVAGSHLGHDVHIDSWWYGVLIPAWWWLLRWTSDTKDEGTWIGER